MFTSVRTFAGVDSEMPSKVCNLKEIIEIRFRTNTLQMNNQPVQIVYRNVHSDTVVLQYATSCGFSGDDLW